MVWAIEIYRLTIINLKYLFAIGAFGAIIGFFALYFSIKTSYSEFWKFLLSLVIGSGIFIFGFLYLNQKFADINTEKNYFKIIKTGTLGRWKGGHCSYPYAVIDFRGTEKEFIFNCKYKQTVKNYSKIALTFSKGLFSFEVIKSRQLTQ